MFVQRRIRWFRLRMYTVPFAIILEPFSQSVPSSLLAAFGLSVYLESVYVKIVIVLHFILLFFCDMLLLRRLTTSYHKSSSSYVTSLTMRQWCMFGLSWIFREITYLPLLVIALTGRHVIWRENRFRLSFGGHITYIPPAVSNIKIKNHGEELLMDMIMEPNQSLSSSPITSSSLPNDNHNRKRK